jgi:hypothetical protein
LNFESPGHPNHRKRQVCTNYFETQGQLIQIFMWGEVTSSALGAALFRPRKRATSTGGSREFVQYQWSGVTSSAVGRGHLKRCGTRPPQALWGVGGLTAERLGGISIVEWRGSPPIQELGSPLVPWVIPPQAFALEVTLGDDVTPIGRLSSPVGRGHLSALG